MIPCSFQEFETRVNRVIEEVIPTAFEIDRFEETLLGILNSAKREPFWEEIIRYPFVSGGKRFRPKLCYYSAMMFGVSEPEAYCLGAATEILHTASLIHDDLPEIDNDDYRRGRLATHKRYNQGLAVVCADELFFLAAKTLLPFKNDHLVEEFLSTAMDLAKGEAYDIYYEKTGLSLSEEDLTVMYRFKTGGLIRFAITSPAIVKRIPAESLASLSDSATKIGLAFQIYDDIKDETGRFEELGKTPQKDMKSGKQTILRIKTLQEAKERADLLWQEAIREIGSYSDSSDETPLGRFLNESRELIIRQ